MIRHGIFYTTVLSGLTPAEAYSGVKGAEFAAKLAEASIEKRKLRLKQNRVNVCEPCKSRVFDEQNDVSEKAS